MMTSSKKSQSTSLDYLSTPVDQCDRSCHIEPYQISSYWCTRPSILQLKHLFIDNYKDAPNWRFTLLARVLYACIIRENSSLIWIRDSKPAGIWTRISGTKSDYAKKWARLHWQLWFLWLSDFLAYGICTRSNCLIF